MKIIEVLTTSILLLLPGAIAPAYALGQHEQEKQPEQKQQQAKPAQHAAQQAKPAQQPQHAAQQAKPAQQPQHAAQQAKPAQQPQRAAQQAKPAQQPQRAAQQQPARSGQQRQGAQQANREQSAGGHGSIPEARFRSNFGRSHTFHVNRGEFANGPGRFQYGGYWFNTVDAWPVGWLYTDDVYVDYLNCGYFLCDPVHPGVYISINIG
jgi:hypothetical protein